MITRAWPDIRERPIDGRHIVKFEARNPVQNPSILLRSRLTSSRLLRR